MYIADTIVAPATAPGQGAVAIVRLSGPAAFEILSKIWRPKAKADLGPRYLALGEIVDYETGAQIDNAMAVRFPAPASLTGEDVAELQCHGGSYLVRRVVALAMHLGARMADPGEFSRRAFLNGRLDLTQAEAIADLVDARGETALRQAISQLTGALAGKVHGLRREVIAIRAHLEAQIDFSDEDLALPSRRQIGASIERLASDVAILHATYERGRLMREGIRAAIVGKPNVGKSSVLNLMLGTDRAIVTAIAGTTRDVVEDSIQLGPYPVVLQDTAGIRDSSDEVEKMGIARSLRSLSDADLAIAVFDGSRPVSQEDREVAAACRDRRGVALLNKTDLPASVTADDLRAIGITMPILPFCALAADQIEPLKCEVVKAIESMSAASGSDDVAISRERHREALSRALEALSAARNSVASAMPPEIIVVDVALAAEALGEITGEVHSEDVLDAIFREFCIGK